MSEPCFQGRNPDVTIIFSSRMISFVNAEFLGIILKILALRFCVSTFDFLR